MFWYNGRKRRLLLPKKEIIINIFATSPCPIECAKSLDSKRVVKMCLETAQLLASAIQINGGRATYKVTHKSHPATIWTARNKSNYRWAMRHFAALCREYTKRYGKTHRCSQYIGEFIEGIKHLPDGEMTPFANCAANKDKGFSFKHIQDVHLAYRMYLKCRWLTDKRAPQWS